MSALNDRLRWLRHVRGCSQCPDRLCVEGARLANAVRKSLLPGETFG